MTPAAAREKEGSDLGTLGGRAPQTRAGGLCPPDTCPPDRVPPAQLLPQFIEQSCLRAGYEYCRYPACRRSSSLSAGRQLDD